MIATRMERMLESASELVESIRESHPHLTKVLLLAERNREQHLSRFRSGARLAGLDEWLGYLAVLEEAFKETPELKRIAFLIRRVASDYEVGIEATVSGMHAVVLDSMRDVMEIHMLLRDFRCDRSRIDQWLNADTKTLLSSFSPAELRKRHAAVLGVKTSDLAETNDYRGHSRSLHVSPESLPWERRGVLVIDGNDMLADICYWEMYGHALSIASEVRELTRALLPGQQIGPDVATELPKVADAYERTNQMKELFFALVRTPQSDDKED